MQEQKNITSTERKLITTRSVIKVSIIVMVLTILSIWLFDLGQHRTLFENSMLSTSVLSLAFFLFLTVGLYKGIKLKDDIGKLTDHLEPSKIPNLEMHFQVPISYSSVTE